MSTPTPIVPTPIVPKPITPQKVRAVLRKAGYQLATKRWVFGFHVSPNPLAGAIEVTYKGYHSDRETPKRNLERGFESLAALSPVMGATGDVVTIYPGIQP